MAQMVQIFLERVENILGKGENADYQADNWPKTDSKITDQ